MRHVIVHESLRENEARPPGAFTHLVERCAASAKKLLEDRARMEALSAVPRVRLVNAGRGVREERPRLFPLRRLPVTLGLASPLIRSVRLVPSQVARGPVSLRSRISAQYRAADA